MTEPNPMHPEPERLGPLGCLIVLIGVPSIGLVLVGLYGILDDASGPLALVLGGGLGVGVSMRLAGLDLKKPRTRRR